MRVRAIFYLLFAWTFVGLGCTTAVAPEPTAAAVPTRENRFLFGMVLVGPEDDQGWSEAHVHGGEYVEANLPGSRLLLLDNLNPDARPAVSLEQAVDDMVAEGAEMIFITSDDFSADTTLVAEKYPDVYFIHATGAHALQEDSPPNLANYMPRMYYGKMIAGCAAALTTQTGHIGYVGAVINDETRRHANAAYLGARYCYERFREQNPDDLQFSVEWVGYWFHIPGVTQDPTKLTKYLVARNADVILSGLDTTDVLKQVDQLASEGQDLWAVPYDYEGACDVAPDVCLGVPYFNWRPGYLHLAEETIAGNRGSHWHWDEPVWNDFANIEVNPVGFKLGPALSAEHTEQLQTFIEGLADGSVVLFQGPLRFENTISFLADGEEATDEQLWNMPYLLEGMEGLSE